MDDQRRHDQGMSVRRAPGVGLGPDEVEEVLLQVAVYVGVPAGNRAFEVAQRALDDTPPGA